MDDQRQGDGGEDGAARAFAQLGREVSLLRSAIEGLSAAREAIEMPDYEPDAEAYRDGARRAGPADQRDGQKPRVDAHAREYGAAHKRCCGRRYARVAEADWLRRYNAAERRA